MKDQRPPKPKPTTQQELLQYQAQADGAAEAAKTAKQRMRKAKAAVKTARAAYREAKQLAAEARSAAKAARKYFAKHANDEPQPASATRKRTRRKAAPRGPSKVSPVAAGPVPLTPVV